MLGLGIEVELEVPLGRLKLLIRIQTGHSLTELLKLPQGFSD